MDCRETAEVKCGRQGVDGGWMSVKAGRSRVDHTEKPKTALLAPREPRKVCSLLASPGWADTARPSRQAAHWTRVQRDAPLRCSQRPFARSMTPGEHPRDTCNEVLKTRCRVNSSQRGKGPRSQRAQMFPEHRLHPWLEYTSQTSVQLEPARMTTHTHTHTHPKCTTHTRGTTAQQQPNFKSLENETSVKIDGSDADPGHTGKQHLNPLSAAESIPPVLAGTKRRVT